MSASLPPGLHVAGEPVAGLEQPQPVAGQAPQPVAGQAAAGGGRPGTSGGLWPLVALTAIELAFVLSLITLGRCGPADAVQIAAATSGIAGVLFYAPRTLTVIGRRLLAAPAGQDRPQ